MKLQTCEFSKGTLIMVKKSFLIIVVFMGVLLNHSYLAQAQQQKTYHRASPPDCQRWRDGATITKTTHEEDIRDTLKSIATANDTPITFGLGIDFKTTLQFEKTPLKSAFESLINNYGLAYFWDGCSIHVFNPETRTTKDVLIQLEKLRCDEVERALQRFGLLRKEIKIVFDSLTNSILLSGTEREIGNIQDIIKVLESAKLKEVKIKPEIRYYPLTYAKVDDSEITVGKRTVLVKGLVTVLTEVLHLTKLGEKREIEVVREAKRLPEGTYPEHSRDASVALTTQARMIKQLIQAEAGTIASDSRTNQIIIRDYPDKLDEYGEMIKQLDRPMKMVKISILIVEASKDFAREFGVGWAGLFDKSSHYKASFGTSEPARDVVDQVGREGSAQTSTLIPLLDTAAGKSISPFGIAGTFLYIGNENLLAATLAAAESKGLSRTINKSSLITMDNMQALVETKQIVTYKIQTGGVNPVVESRDIDAGLALRVTPHIIERGGRESMIELVVEAERSTFLETATDGIPERAATDLSTQAIVGDKGTVVIGGVFENRYAVSETGVPCLMNLPALGYLFKTADAKNPKVNILFFLTPHVISLEKIPYESPHFKEKIQRYEEELREIDPDKRQKLIEKYQDYQDYQ